ncbi:MAG: hypothetical protein KF893_13205 [Caldilineaceae bacterium]|nr:hypothetical protein [Caldilineaceae bacterium]
MLRQSSLRFIILALWVFVAILIRSLLISWQPLWWDEGYSVYFATEPMTTMLRLTVQDIHPPLYYALLHGWLTLWGSASPLALRSFSILIGVLAIPAIWWLARILFPARSRRALLSVLLLTISPMHIFYSQEVRMYGLELLLGIVSTGFFWRMADCGPQTADSRQRTAENAHHAPHSLQSPIPNIQYPISISLGYILSTTALLYTEYYAVLLPLAHFVWALWFFRSDLRRLGQLVVADLVVALLYLPWLIYAIPELMAYIPQKIIADADRPLGPLLYLWRHFSTFVGGHIPTAEPALYWLQLSSAIAVALFIAIWLISRQPPVPSPQSPIPSPQSFITFLLLLPTTVAFLINLRLPFFPDGGERVLLFVLPFFLLLLASGMDTLWRRRSVWNRLGAGLGWAGLSIAALTGIWTFYTVPRYAENDYRPLIRQTVQQGSDEDMIFAVYPWQVGYWRAYAPIWGRGEQYGPWPILSPSPGWDESVAAALDDALARGKVWFPAHLSLGGILEGEIEAYLAARTLSFENRWYTPTTRLSGWALPSSAQSAPINAEIDFGPLRLNGESTIGAAPIASANQILPITLQWTLTERDALPLLISLRLLDDEGRVWANRDLQLAQGDPALGGSPVSLGLLVPVGLPPAWYQIGIGVGPAAEERLLPVQTAEGPTDVVSIGVVQVQAPSELLPSLRLPIQQRLAEPANRSSWIVREGVAFLGFSGYDPNMPTLAGTEMALSLFVRSEIETLSDYRLYISLLDRNGAGVAGWEGWPLTNYPTTAWRRGSLVRLPVRFYLPATLSAGNHTLLAGLMDPLSGEKSTPVKLGDLPVARREIRLEAPPIQTPLTPPYQIGAHARLIGYDQRVADDMLLVTLYWEVLQTLLPPHQVFFHLTAADGTLLAQDDGLPGRRAIAAPSGTWLPGEIIVDPHRVALPADLPNSATIRTGLYIPETGVRLPVFRDEQPLGDAVTLEIGDWE